MTLTNEIKYRLLAGRLARDYANSPDAGMSFGPRKVHVNLDNVWCFDPMANHMAGAWVGEKECHLFAFGAYSNTYVLAFGSLESALEDAAATLKEVAPGCFVEPDYDAYRGAVCAGADESELNETRDMCEADFTYTEAGWLPSYEWTIVASGWSPAEIRAWARNER